MTLDLRFKGALGPQPGGSVALVFGGTLPPPVFDPPAGSLRAAVGSRWSPAAAVPARPAAGPWRLAAPVGGRAGAAWGAATAQGALVAAGWRSTAALGGSRTAAAWGSALHLGGHVGAAWGSAVLTRGETALGWRAALRVPARVLVPWSAARPMPTRMRAPWAGGQHMATWAPGRAGQGEALRPAVRAPWATGQLVESVGGPWTPSWTQPPTPGCWAPEPGEAVTLVFRTSWDGLAQLIFSCRRAALALVPVRRVYMVTNVTTLVRVSDGAAVPCFSFSLSLDVGSWAWGFSASLPADVLAMVEPDEDGDPVELVVTVNGTQFRVIAEALARERTFGQAAVRVTGRSRIAVLDAPYSAVQVYGNVSEQTAQQLVDGVLPSGWTADWGLTAWPVPGNVWTHEGTPISAALAVAGAAGGYLLPHASLASFAVLPRYPVAPWDWGSVSPDVELPSAVVQREAIEWSQFPRYNRVYVSGSASGGKLVRVTRAGTAGDLAAPMVTDSLITHGDAGMQRGLAVLARTGRWADVTLRLPVLPETGVMRPGKFVRYVDGSTVRFGLVRAVSVDSGLTEVWQSIKVESYVDA